MLLVVLLVLLPQRLDPPRRVAHPGDEVVLRAIDRQGQPQAGVPVAVRTPSGTIREVAATDARGEVEFVPQEVGMFEFSAEFPGQARVLVVYHVVARPRRWLWALVLTPLGIFLLYKNLGRWRVAPRP